MTQSTLDTATHTTAELEAMLLDKNNHLYQQSQRLVRTGRMEGATLGDLDHILAVDAIEQKISKLIADWFNHYDLAHHTVAEANVALALIYLDMILDPDLERDIQVAA